jgi:DNA-3-methyladenine glycosylase I
MSDRGLIRSDDGTTRCSWGDSPEIYRAYHDTEWGFPVADDQRLFEKLCLEGFQSGLSWLTILRKRENFRAAFEGFDFERVARFGERDVVRLLGDAGIIRHRGKIEATINNARRAVELVESEGSLASYIWTSEPDPAVLAKDLKRRGWRFVGPTTVYAFMQAMGLVNDHVEGCAIRPAVEQARARFVRPSG